MWLAFLLLMPFVACSTGEGMREPVNPSLPDTTGTHPSGEVEITNL